MPAFKGICTTLESQYDVKQIQEYMLPSPRPSHLSSFSRRSSSSSDDPKLLSPVKEVHVPTYPNSQFWLSYFVVPHMLQLTNSSLPSQDAETATDKVKYVYFKLILPSPSPTNAAPGVDDNTTISWGVGAKDGWKGKTMFGLFKSTNKELAWSLYPGRDRVDKCGFWFSRDETNEGTFDLQVFRARGRRRESRFFPPLHNKHELVRLVNMGKLKGHQPQRYYQYALLDAVDTPYVTFRYHLRSIDSLLTLGISPQQPLLNPMKPRYYFPTDDETERHQSSFNRKDGEDEESSVSSYASAEEARACDLQGEHDEEFEYEETSEETYQSARSGIGNFSDSSPVPSEHRHSHSWTDQQEQKEGEENARMTNAFRRLSVPPTIRLVPSSSTNEPHSPAKDLDNNKGPVKTPFLRDASSPIDNSLDHGVDNANHVHYHSLDFTLQEESVARAEAKTGPPNLCRPAREGLEVARRNFVLRTPSPIALSHTDQDAENSSNAKEKEKEKYQATPPDSGRRVGGSRFLKGVLESALRRRGEKPEGSTGERRGSEEKTADDQGERDDSWERKGTEGAREKLEKKGINYVAVRNSF